jgi:hypothetical protein
MKAHRLSASGKESNRAGTVYVLATSLLQDCANVDTSLVREMALSKASLPVTSRNNVFYFCQLQQVTGKEARFSPQVIQIIRDSDPRLSTVFSTG